MAPLRTVPGNVCQKDDNFSLINQINSTNAKVPKKFNYSKRSFVNKECSFDNPARSFPKKAKKFFCLKSGKVEKVVNFLRDMYFLKMFFGTHKTPICQQCRTILTKTDNFFLKVAKIVFERFSVSRSILLLNCTLHFSEQC